MEKQERKERDYAEGVEVKVNSVEVKTMFANQEQVAKITFVTDKGNITYKPKVEKVEHRNGLTIKRTEECSIDDIPKKVIEVSQEISDKGYAIVLVAYSVWNTDKDGQPVTYRFVQGGATLEKWKILKETVATEEVGDKIL